MKVALRFGLAAKIPVRIYSAGAHGIGGQEQLARYAAILDAMVREGYIGEMDGSTRARPILQKAYEDLQDLAEMQNEQ